MRKPLLIIANNGCPKWAQSLLEDLRTRSNIRLARGLASGALPAWFAALPEAPFRQASAVLWLGPNPRWCGVPTFSVGQVSSRFSGLKEVACHIPLSHVGVFLHTEKETKCLDERQLSTQRRWGPNRVFMQAYAVVMLRNLLADKGWENPEKRKPISTAQPCSLPLWQSLLHLPLYWLRVYPQLLAYQVATRMAKLFGYRRNFWRLYLLRGNLLKEGAPLQCQPLQQSPGTARADPFVARLKNQLWLFFEEYSARAPMGVLKAAPFNVRTGTTGTAHLLMQRQHHLSYPQVVQLGKHMYLLPETHAARHLELLPLQIVNGVPEVGKPAQTLLEGTSCADATYWQDAKGQGWLFVSLNPTSLPDHSVELHLYRVEGKSKKGLGKLVPHPANPVVRSSRFARCAGPLFIDEKGRLIRPCQAHVHGMYGAEVNFMEITKLSMEAYEERRVATLPPTFHPGLNGTHHVCRLDETTYVVDARQAWSKAA